MKRTRSAFEPGSRALYERPRYYDHAFRAHRKDVAFYLALAQQALFSSYGEPAVR